MNSPIEEYLVKLGFRVDGASMKRFNAAVAASAKEAAGLGAVMASTATAIGVSVESVAREYEGLFYLSQRTRSSVNDLKAYSYAAKQIGIDAGQSTSTIQSFAAAMRRNPGVQAFVAANGGVGKDAVEQLTNFIATQKQLFGEDGYFVAAMNAAIGGIPEDTFRQMWDNLPKMNTASKEMKRLRMEAGLAGDELTNKGVEFANAWDHLLGVLDIGKDRIANDLIDPTTKGVKAIDEIVQAFNRADVASNGWLGTIVGVGSAVGGTTAAIALLLRMLGFGGLAGLAGRGALALIGGAAGGAAAGAYYGFGLNGETAGKADDEPLSKEYRAKHGSFRGGTADAMRDQTIAYFMGQGWSRAAATGIAANIGAESNFNPAAVGDGGQAVGLAQWHPDRQRAFKEWSGKDLAGSSFQDQLAFIQHELTAGRDAGARRAGEKLRTESDAYNAGAIFSGLYERPAGAEWEAHKRGNKALAWYDVPLTQGAVPSETSGAPTINQTNNVNITATDTSDANMRLRETFERSAADLVRNFRGATQ